jgi:hypothetical protein
MPVNSYNTGSENQRATYRAPAVAEKPDMRVLEKESWAYLIAAKDGTVWLAREYSVQNGRLHFVTTGNDRRQVPVTDVDRMATEQLNRERGVDLRLP